MKFLFDAQLPWCLARTPSSVGHDVVHSMDLPNGNRSSDPEIIEIADRDARVVVTKDSDFVHSHLLHGHPARLRLVSTGNITNKELHDLFVTHLDQITQAFELTPFVELGRVHLIIH